MRFLKPVHIFHKRYIPMKRWGYTIFAPLLFTVTQYESQWNPITNVRFSYCTVKLVKHHKMVFVYTVYNGVWHMKTHSHLTRICISMA